MESKSVTSHLGSTLVAENASECIIGMQKLHRDLGYNNNTYCGNVPSVQLFVAEILVVWIEHELARGITKAS